MHRIDRIGMRDEDAVVQCDSPVGQPPASLPLLSASILLILSIDAILLGIIHIDAQNRQDRNVG